MNHEIAQRFVVITSTALPDPPTSVPDYNPLHADYPVSILSYKIFIFADALQSSRLDLGHARSALADSAHAATEVHAGAATGQSGEDGRGSEAGESEPEEGSGSLRLVASLASVGGAVCDTIGRCVGLIS